MVGGASHKFKAADGMRKLTATYPGERGGRGSSGTGLRSEMERKRVLTELQEAKEDENRSLGVRKKMGNKNAVLREGCQVHVRASTKSLLISARGKDGEQARTSGRGFALNK